ncbi:heavy metal translocating P-type ATPase [Paracandidimonas soli]|uniref:heavy metal translocating P-type ATPase n=1 Tax=Paracandidimonas soli TaxID=1917182 RepID=UPI00334287D2
MNPHSPQPHASENTHSHGHRDHRHTAGSCCQAEQARGNNDQCRTACSHSDAHEHAAPAPTPVVPGAVAFHIPAMDCASEESQIREVLAPVGGIERLTFSLGSRTLFLHAAEGAIAQARQAIETLGFQVHLQDDATAQKSGRRRARWMAIRMGAALALALVAELIAFGTSHGAAPGSQAWNIAGMALAGMAILLAGFSTYIKGLHALRNLRLNISALMTVAVTGAFLIGQWPEAAMVMALYAIAELIEARAVDRARNAVKQLLDLAPVSADVLQADGGWKSLTVEKIAVGERIRIRPGARVALDGVIEDGQTAIDQSSVTGESLPVEKQPGDHVFAGTINQSGLIIVRTTALASDSTLARIVREVETAQSRRAPTQQFVDKFAAVYTPLVFLLAIASTAWMRLVSGADLLDAIYTGLVLLVIACPCALVIATPVTIVSGLTAAARRGILIKGGVYLENAHRLRAVALDKTGTITEGKPGLLAVEQVAAEIPRSTVLRWARGLSAASDHPVSQAIAAGLAAEAKAAAVQDFKALSGRGVQAAIDGKTLFLGNHRLIEELGVCNDQVEALLSTHERQGRTVTMLADETAVLAVFAVADAIKPSSREAIAAMHAQDIRIVMLTGDNQATADAIAAQAGLDTAVGELLPEDKLARVRELQRQYGSTGMTGDGINDAPALAQADIGFAMGKAGTGIAVETADIVLMTDDLRRIPETIDLSRRARRILIQNIGLALGIKLIFMVLALTGNATMWMAVFADMGASLLVVFNGLRLLSGAQGKAG